MHELRDAPEAPLGALLRKLSPVDLIIVEGFKTAPHAKIEVYRQANGKAPLHPGNGSIVAVASDVPFPDAVCCVVGLNDIPAIADLVQAHAVPLMALLRQLDSAG